jgi:hypothetical protein
MMEERIFPIAKYLITQRIPHDHYYFKDVLFIFLTAIKIDDNRIREYWDALQRHILTPTTTSLIRVNLEEKILAYFRVTDFIPVKEGATALDKKESKTEVGKG